MDSPPLNRWRGFGLMAFGITVVLGMLLALGFSVENSVRFSLWYPTILMINVGGALLLAVLLARRVLRLVRDYRNHVPGSRLTARTVFIFGTLVVVPLLVMYLFWLGFLNRGINSWFKDGVKEPFQRAAAVSYENLDQLSAEHQQRTVQLAARLATRLAEHSGSTLAATLEAERKATESSELAVYGRDGALIAASTAQPSASPHPVAPELLEQIRAGRPYRIIEGIENENDDYVFVSEVPIPAGKADFSSVVVARQPVPHRDAAIFTAVHAASRTYDSLSDSRQPLKSAFRYALTMVLLLAALSAIFLAIRFAHKLTRPVHDLIQGTRAVGKGDFGTRLMLPSHDEMGILVQSFNDMTKRLRRASEETARSRALVEDERERLAVILSGLSAGVLVIDTAMRLRQANAAAGAILAVPLDHHLDADLASIAGSQRLTAFAAELARRLASGASQWQAEIPLPPDRVMRCSCAPLPAAAGEAGYVIVFDDITGLLHAQRDAAWGEVARRLAHEIKNPLTPVQLAAERLRRRLEGKLDAADADVLERATHTIVQQVETLKGMVNAFSDYARDPELKLAPVNLNELIAEVVELYRAQGTTVSIQIEADPALPPLLADRGRLRQVLNNLIANALEAVETVPSALVTVVTQINSGPGAKSAVIMVTDNGNGFDEDMLARVFDPYVTSKPRGTGLGLAIVKKIAEEHGGSIEANNRPEGGAYVRVVLPLAPQMQAPQFVRA